MNEKPQDLSGSPVQTNTPTIVEIDGKLMFRTRGGTYREVQKLPTVEPPAKRRRRRGHNGRYRGANAMKNAY